MKQEKELKPEELIQEEDNEDFDELDETSENKQKLANFLDSMGFTIFISIITIYALFGDDIRVVFFNKDGDFYFYIATSLCLVLFSIEILLSCYSKPDYLFSFFFYLDIVSTASLLFDIGWFSDLIFDSSTTGTTTENAAQLAKAARASRIGTRAARVIRIIRLIRLIRIVKLYKATQRENKEEEKDKQKLRRHSKKLSRIEGRRLSQVLNGGIPVSSQKLINPESSRIGVQRVSDKEIEADKKKKEQQDKELEMILKETEVGKKITSKITKIVITLILLIMLSTSLFAIDTYIPDYVVENAAITSLSYLLRDPYSELTKSSVIKFYDNFQDMEPKVRYVALIDESDSSTFLSYGSIDAVESLRSSEQTYYTASTTLDNGKTYTVIAGFDSTKTALINGILGIMRTIFVCVILASSTILLSNDAETLVIQPLQDMLKKVNRISENPLEAAKLEEEEAERWEKIMEKDKSTRLAMLEKANYEPSKLENIIMKIGALLAIGFGEAGSTIIAENMKGAGDMIDPMLPGQKMYAIFGFCDIRYFPDITEALKTDIMIFVNQIAEIVHGNVADSLGNANKNIGDAFLLVWKIPQEETTIVEGKLTTIPNGKHTGILADLSVYSFLRIIADINKSSEIAKYSENKALTAKLKRPYKIKMGFGLHIGWGIEGAIGSVYKMDASYLSPNVNISARLEAATKQFGVTLLISGVLEELLSPHFRKLTRLCDRVTVKGSILPIELYTVDLDVSRLEVVYPKNASTVSVKEKRKQLVKRRNKTRVRAENLYKERAFTRDILRDDDDITQMREPFTEEFFQRWEKGIEDYLSGNWSSAWDIFKETQDMLTGIEDGPSKTLLNVIKSEGGEAPNGWNRFRELTSK